MGVMRINPGRLMEKVIFNSLFPCLDRRARGRIFLGEDNMEAREAHLPFTASFTDTA
jgi:hypothetical protein